MTDDDKGVDYDKQNSGNNGSGENDASGVDGDGGYPFAAAADPGSPTMEAAGAGAATITAGYESPAATETPNTFIPGAAAAGGGENNNVDEEDDDEGVMVQPWVQDDTKPFHGLNVDDLASLTDKRYIDMLKKRFISVENIATMLYSDSKAGLSQGNDVQQLSMLPVPAPDANAPDFGAREKAFGKNENPKPKPKWLITLFFEALNDLILIILILFAILSLILGLVFPETPEERAYSWIEGAAILLAVFIVSSVTAINDWSKERKFRELSKTSDDIDIKTIREATNTTVKISKLVVGDIVELDVGDMIAADGLLIEGHDLKIDESAMTGETDLIKKSVQGDPFLLSGCKVQEGVGKMIITAVGRNSQWGKTLELLSKKKKKEDSSTPLEKKLDSLAKLVGYIGIFFGVTTTLILLAGWLIRKIVMHSQNIPAAEIWSTGDIVEVVRFIVIGVTIIVVAVPEGLPLAVTISLAYSVKKMMKDNNLVRHLSACETMGGCTNICSDKTGTLTLNQMRVKKALVAGKYFDVLLPRTQAVQNAKGMTGPTVSDNIANILAESIAVNSKANLVTHAEPSKGWDVQGNKTEGAMLLMIVSKFGTDYRAIREKYGETKIEKLYTFSSLKKRMSIIIRLDDQSFRLHTKGASEIVLKLCSTFVDESGDKYEITSDKRAEFENIIVTMASQGLRTICIASKDMPADADKSQWEDQEVVENDLTLLTIVGIKDPLRKEVPEAVAQCRRSGITVRMVTGDNILTAQHIARECGILHGDGVAVEGPKFRAMSLEEKQAILPRLQVMARSSPQDKYDLVELIQSTGKDVVAVTGDGTNDAPALKKADVGLSMGISGTQVAKEASDIIILDDNFLSIVKAVLWGRSIYENIRKFLTFQLTVNIVALVLTMISAITAYLVFPYTNADKITGRPAEVHFKPPIAPIQLLWVNLIMDTMAALALATEPPVPELLNRKPYKKTESLVTWKMWVQLLSAAAYQLAWLLAIIYAGIPALESFYNSVPAMGYPNYPQGFNMANKSDVEYIDGVNRTWVFHTFVLMQIFNEINARKINMEFNIFHNIHHSPMYVIVIIITMVIQTVLVVIPVNPVFQTNWLSWPHWIVALGTGVLIIPFIFCMKVVVRLCMLLFSKRQAALDDDEGGAVSKRKKKGSATSHHDFEQDDVELGNN